MKQMFARVFGWFLTRQTFNILQRQRLQSERQVSDGVVRSSDDPDARRAADQSRGWYAMHEDQRRQQSQRRR
jgi:hypothetical protein